MASRVLWLGSRRPGEDGSRFLAAAGFRIDTFPSLEAGRAALSEVDIVVVALGAHDGPPARSLPPLVAALPEGVKVLAVVHHPADVVPALVAGAHDAMTGAGAGDELYVRVLAWARAARAERQQRAALHALADRARQLETQLHEREREVAKLRADALRDDLTTLGNRRSFFEALEHALEYGARYGGAVAVVALDLDGMKSLNDTCGHPTGDAALCTVAEVLRASLRSVDHAARLGGDEFGIVMPATNAPAAAQVAERIRNRIEQLLLPRGLRLSASFGVAADERPQRGATGFNLVARADAALYAAKRDGKNRVVTEPTTKQTEAA